MTSQATGEDAQPAPDSQQTTSSPTGWIMGHYRRLKIDAEAFPHVWASYILVYGGWGLWIAYRFRCLRKAEDRLLVHQAKMRKKIEAEIEAENAARAKANKAAQDATKPKE